MSPAPLRLVDLNRADQCSLQRRVWLSHRTLALRYSDDAINHQSVNCAETGRSDTDGVGSTVSLWQVRCPFSLLLMHSRVRYH